MLKELKSVMGESAYDLTNLLTREYLIECYVIAVGFPDEPDHDKLMKALRRTIKYISSQDEYKEFKDAL